MGFTKYLRGLGSGNTYPADRIMNLDPIDQRPVEMVLDVEAVRRARPDLSWYTPSRKNMWRFGALLPLDMDDPEDRPFITTLGEGYTPQLDYSDHPEALKTGFRLEVKDEGHPHAGYGENPTHSFKDRGMAVVASMARKLGLTRLAVPTQGNAGDSLVEYGLKAGLAVAVAMPEDTPLPILGKVAACAKIHPSITLDLVKGTIREAGQLLKKGALAEGFFSVATFQEPGWRIEGKKTLGLELAEPKPGQNEWKLPDVVLYPTGGGTGMVGMWKAFAELEALGVIGPRRPKMVSVQAEATAPLVHAFERHLTDTEAAPPGRTLAFGLNVPGGVGHFQVLKIIEASGGCAVAVTEETIAESLRRAYQTKGWWLCPEGAACLAALEPLTRSGTIRSGDHVVAFNTGSFEKYLPDLRHLLI